MSEAHGKKKDKELLDGVFRVYDDNQDGYVDFVEFMAVFYIMTEKPPEDIFTKIFQMFDIDNNGFITRKEMLILVRTLFSLNGTNNPEDASQEFHLYFISITAICPIQ